MRLIRQTAFALTFLPACLGLAQGNFDNVTIKTTPVAGDVHMLEGAGGNIGVCIGSDGVLIVDTQFAPLAPKIEAALKRLGDGKLHYVLNTHWHGDHTGGNEFFGKQGTVIAHDNVRRRLTEKTNPAVAPEGLPDITHDQGLTLHFNGETIRVVSLPPGHTDGDCYVYFTKSKVLHLGDQFFNGKFPFIDLGSGGEVAGYVRNVETALKLAPPDAKIIPGHGPLATVDDLRRFRDMLVETTGIVRKAIEAGKTLDQVKEAGLPEKWKDWGTGFINTSRWLEITYNSLKAK
ncbi:MAG: MBL fold metallo-hydrolase [Verrucomicrobiales bacterium]|nr:MBL fold metallo-hydrolase [Verrucomicrobiales bacterium]